jgi:hypothetical protein
MEDRGSRIEDREEGRGKRDETTRRASREPVENGRDARFSSAPRTTEKNDGQECPSCGRKSRTEEKTKKEDEELAEPAGQCVPGQSPGTRISTPRPVRRVPPSRRLVPSARPLR